MPRTGGTGGTSHILTPAALRLYLLAKISPSAWDAINPQGPKYSKGTLQVIAAQIIKAVATSVKSPKVQKELNALGKELYQSGASSMNYEDDSIYCGTPFPVPHFGAGEYFIDPAVLVELNPQPLPPKEYFAGILKLVSESIGEGAIAARLQQAAGRL